jgi:SAM-dependent methyltransferase
MPPSPTSPGAAGTRTAGPDRLEAVRDILIAHPAVAAAELVVEPDPAAPGTDRLVARIRPAEPPAAGSDEERARVDEWHLIYEWVYGEMTGSGELGDDFVGWHSTYTGEPIPLSEMREWRDATVDRIRSLRPRRVLEIGVGTGLLMGRFAAEVEEYLATDFSETVVQTLRAQVAALPQLDGKVTLQVREANDFAGLPVGHFDTVVINSVVQYFPDGTYLADVVNGAIRALAPGGALLVGDVRNRRLLRAFRTAVLAGEVAAQESAEAARFLVERSALEEKELVVDPAFFTAVRDGNPDISSIDVRLKRAHAHNELSRHRYDVVLRKQPAPAARPAATTLTWDTDVRDLATLRTLLTDAPAPVRVAGVPNARVLHEVAAVPGTDTGRLPATAIDPEQLWSLGAGLGLSTVVTWAADGSPERVDAVFGGDADVPVDAPVEAGAAVATYANDPKAASRTAAFVTALRDYLADHLPADRIPQEFVVVRGTSEEY